MVRFGIKLELNSATSAATLSLLDELDNNIHVFSTAYTLPKYD